jgi:ParB family chromosome partitioning protein
VKQPFYEGLSLETVDIGDIDFEDESFLISFPVQSESLVSSIKECGLINPPLLRKKGGCFQIVCGFRRLSACRELKAEKIPALVCDPEILTDKEAFCVNFFKNASGRAFNMIEKGVILKKLVQEFRVDEKEYRQKFLPVLGLSLAESERVLFFRLLDCHESIKRYVVEQDVSLKNILLWMSLSGREETIFSFFKELNLSSNKMREALLFLQEISRRDKVTIEDILKEPALKSVLHDERMSVPEKTSRIRELLKKKRFPCLGSMEESFLRRVKELKLPKGVSLRHPEFFEEQGIVIEARIRSREELGKLGRKLSEISEKNELSDLLGNE